LQNAWKKYGEGAFRFEVVCLAPSDDADTLNRLEAQYISDLRSFGMEGYNLCTGGVIGRSVSEETRERLRLSHVGQKKKPVSAETRERLRLANVGKVIPPEARAKMRAARLGKPAWNKGLSGYRVGPASDSRKAKIGAAQRGPLNHNYGKPTPEAVKEKIRAANGGAKCYLAKLDDEKVRAIKKRIAAGENQAAMAREYGVTPTQITCIKQGKTWRHVT
jgi:hypothetical protein